MVHSAHPSRVFPNLWTPSSRSWPHSWRHRQKGTNLLKSFVHNYVIEICLIVPCQTEYSPSSHQAWTKSPTSGLLWMFEGEFWWTRSWWQDFIVFLKICKYLLSVIIYINMALWFIRYMTWESKASLKVPFSSSYCSAGPFFSVWVLCFKSLGWHLNVRWSTLWLCQQNMNHAANSTMTDCVIIVMFLTPPYLPLRSEIGAAWCLQGQRWEMHTELVKVMLTEMLNMQWKFHRALHSWEEKVRDVENQTCSL